MKKSLFRQERKPVLPLTIEAIRERVNSGRNRMKRFSLLAVILGIGILASCSFDAKVQSAPNGGDTLELHEYLALQHLEESHEVTQEELQSQLGQFLGKNAASRGANSPASSIIAVQKFSTTIDDGFSSATSNNRSADVAQEASEIPFYLFGIANPIEETSGYALTCGDSRLPAVLAVVEDGEFDWDHPFTDIFYSNLAAYVLETIELYNNVTDEDIASAQEKAEVINQQRGVTTTANGITTYVSHAVPLTAKTEWAQSLPYWDVINSIRGNTSSSAKVVTGCVATAVAQIMAYHKTPAFPSPKHRLSLLRPSTEKHHSWIRILTLPHTFRVLGIIGMA